MYMRKIMVGKMFAGGRVSSFHLTLRARHSVRRLLQRWLEGEVICRRAGSTIYGSWPEGRQGICRPLRASTGLEGRWKDFRKYDRVLLLPDCVGLSRPVNPH